MAKKPFRDFDPGYCFRQKTAKIDFLSPDGYSLDFTEITLPRITLSDVFFITNIAHLFATIKELFSLLNELVNSVKSVCLGLSPLP